MVDDDESLIPIVGEEMLDHLEILSKSFHGYFEGRELKTSEKWIINPYFFNLDYDEKLKDDLIELCTNHVF